MSQAGTYEMVVGLEVHIELDTANKLFCGCPTAYGAPPNSQCCPVCGGAPGARPVLNPKAVELAVSAGLATGCTIAPISGFDRKHYTYPDLPKGYQITQFYHPLCQNGHIDITTEAGEKRIGITRIHLEEDAGKLVYAENGDTLLDMNRCGIPLVEVVSEPDIRSAEEAVAYLKKLRSIVMYCRVSDGRMNEGSLRCDINLSVRKKGTKTLGTRTEVKNLNSFAHVAKAIHSEFTRQVQLLESGAAVFQQTLRFEPATGRTSATRAKEDTADYRYQPEPDLPPVTVTSADIRRLREALPRLPDTRKEQYVRQYGLTAYHSEQLVQSRPVAELFEQAAALSAYPGQVAALILSQVLRLAADGQEELPLSPAALARVADLAGSNTVNSGGAKQLLQTLWTEGGNPDLLVEKLGLRQQGNPAKLQAVADAVLRENPAAVQAYRSGKTAALKALMGLAMAKTDGRGDPKMLRQLLLAELENGH